MKAQKVEHFLQWRKATNQAGTHKVNRLANSDRPILDKTKHQRGDLVPEATAAGWDVNEERAIFTLKV